LLIGHCEYYVGQEPFAMDVLVGVIFYGIYEPPWWKWFRASVSSH